jgi:hypothetical protein
VKGFFDEIEDARLLARLIVDTRGAAT